MKKTLLMSALLSVVLTACSKAGPSADGGGECVLTARFGLPATRLAADGESIRNVQVFVFRAGGGGDAGVLDAAASAGFGREAGPADDFRDLCVKCTSGLREIWVVVNDSRDRTGDTAVRTKVDFLALTHDLEQSAPDCLLMIGRSNPESPDPAVRLTEGAMELQIPVHRLAASVVLESVRNAFVSPAYRDPGIFRLEAAYLLNVPGRINFGESADPAALDHPFWYARLEPERSGPRAALLYDDLGGTVLDYGAVYDSPHTFYAYPNDCAPSGTAGFSPRATLLVLEASVQYPDGRMTCYYPVELGDGLQSNRQYRIDLTVHRPGARDPGQAVGFGEATPEIHVSDWDDGDIYHSEI